VGVWIVCMLRGGVGGLSLGVVVHGFGGTFVWCRVGSVCVCGCVCVCVCLEKL